MQRKTECTNCTSDYYQKTRSDDGLPTWTCNNCHAVTSRQIRNRKSNKARAFEAHQTISAEWSATDSALETLREAGRIKSGSIIVHGSGSNHSLTELLMAYQAKRFSTFSLHYHIKTAREDLDRARVSVVEHNATI